MRIQFTVPAIPIAQPRQRHAMIGGHVRNYTPSKHPVQDFKASVRMAWHYARWDGVWDFSAPVKVEIVAVFPRPKSKTKKRGDNPRFEKATKPDWDNVGKSVCDALTGLAWNDDSQIWDARVTKYVAAAEEQPSVTITIETI